MEPERPLQSSQKPPQVSILSPINPIYTLTPRSWALLEKPPVVQLLKNFSIFYGTRGLNYRVHMSPSLVPILSQINPVHNNPPYLSKIQFNIILPPMSRSSEWSLTFWLSHQNPPRVLHDLPTQSTHTHFISFILIFDSHLRLGLPRYRFN
jgi:hypothetical protein